MERSWKDNQPIYRQLRDRMLAMIIDKQLQPGDALPSVRQVSAELGINALTVLKAYGALADDALVEKRRGLGMFVTDGAADRALRLERDAFLRERWPEIHATVRRLGLDLPTLLLNTDGAA